jgi:peptide/nickel transport system substrate-binding protein
VNNIKDITTKYVNRRSFLRAGALGTFGLAAAAVIGCGDDDSAASTSSPAAIKEAPKKIAATHLTFGKSALGETMNPNLASRRSVEWTAVYDTVSRTMQGPDGPYLEPSLATGWEVDPKDKSWVFSIKDAEWSDGKKLTADDVGFTVQYAANPENKSRLISRVNTFESYEVIDDKTVRFKTKKPDATWANRMSLAFIQPRHIYEDATKGSAAQAITPVGSGSYVITNYVKDAVIEGKESPSSWKGNVGIKTWKMNVIKEHTTRVAAFETGDVDWIDVIPLQEVERVGAMPGVSLKNSPSYGTAGYHLSGWQSEGIPTNDVRVRKAYNLATDNASIAATIYSGFYPVASGQPTVPAVLGHHSGIKDYGFDPDAARQNMKDAGMPNGFKQKYDTHSLNSEAVPMATAIAGFLDENIGIESQLAQIDISTWRDGLYGRKARTPIFSNTWHSTSMFDAGFCFTWYLSNNAAKYYGNKEFDKNYEESLTIFDPAARAEVYKKNVQMLHDDVVGLFVVDTSRFMAWRPDVIPNYEIREDPMLILDATTLA